MKLVWHIVWKDLRRLRWWGLAWIAVLALPLVQGFVLLYRSPLPLTPGAWAPSQIQAWLRVFEAVAAYLLTLVLLQEDGVAGARQFWVTRPISNARLLAAKVIDLAVVFVALPIALSLPWWLWCGFGGPQIAAAAGRSIVSAALVVAPAAAIAVITDSLGRALLWTLVFLALVFANVALFFNVIRNEREFAMVATQVALSVTLVLVELVAIVLLRFLLRARIWPVVALLAAMAGSVWYARSVSWTWFTEPRPLQAEKGAGLELGTPTFTDRASPMRRPLSVQQIDVVFPIQKLPTEGNLVGLFATQQWTLGDAGRVQANPFLSVAVPPLSDLGLHAPLVDAETQTAWEKHWKERFPNQPVPQLRSDGRIAHPKITEFTTLRKSLIAGNGGEALGFKTKIWFALEMAEIGVETSLEDRSWHASGGVGLRIDETHLMDGGLWATVVSTSPATVSHWLPRALQSGMRVALEPRLIAIHRGLGEIAQAQPGKPVETFVDGVAIMWSPVNIPGGRIFRGTKWLPRPGWREGVSLGLVVPHPVAIFSREVDVPRVRIDVQDETRPANTP